MASRSCKRDADSFCYICGEFIKLREKKYDLSTNLKICEAYLAYFNIPVKNQDKQWAPHVSCNTFRYILNVPPPQPKTPKQPAQPQQQQQTKKENKKQQQLQQNKPQVINITPDTTIEVVSKKVADLKLPPGITLTRVQPHDKKEPPPIKSVVRIMEIKSESGQSYTIPLDSVDLTYLSKHVRTPNVEKRPLWTRKRLDGESEYCYVQIATQADDEDCYSEETFDTFNCHICNIEVPVLCLKIHNESEKHVTLKTIFQKVLERVSKQINISVSDIDKDMDEHVYYCVPCSKIIKIENKQNHESSQYHVKSQRSINIVHEFSKIFEENKGYVGVKKVDTEEILNEKSFGSEIIQNDTKNNNVKDVTNEDKSNNDETKTVSSINDHTIKPTCTVEHLVPTEKHKEFTTEENYFKYMSKKYNLKANMPIVDGEFILVASPSGVTVKISRDYFHSYLSVDGGIRVFCQMCHIRVELRDESRHKVSEEHSRNVFLPINEQFGRSRNVYSSHCLICNTLVMTSSITKHHLSDDKHVKLLNSAKLTDICHNNEHLANSINTEMKIERTRTERHKIGNHVHEPEKNQIKECMNNNHHNESGHLTRTKDATSVQKLVVCKLCNVSVPQDQVECHNAETTHSSNALKTKNCTGVADGLQACFTKDILKTGSESEVQNDTPRNDNVAKHNSTPNTDNVTNQNVTLKNDNNDVMMKCTENDVPKNDNVTNQNDTLKSDYVAKHNDVSENDNGTNQNAISKNDNVTNQNDTLENDNNDVSMKCTENGVPKNSNEPKQNDVPKNNSDTNNTDNVTNQIDILKNDSSENDNITNQNDTLINDNVAKQNDVSENDNVTNQNDTLKNDNNDVLTQCSENGVPKSYNVAKRNDSSENDNVTNQNDTLKNDNVAKQNDSSENDNVTNQNDTSKNDNVTNQNDISKNDNVAKQNDVSENDNVTIQNDTLENDNNDVMMKCTENDVHKNDKVTNRNVTLKNENVAKQNDVSEIDNETNQNAVSKNDNVTIQNDTLKNDNVAKQNDVPKNDNVAKQNDVPKTDNEANQNAVFKNDNAFKQMCIDTLEDHDEWYFFYNN